MRSIFMVSYNFEFDSRVGALGEQPRGVFYGNLLDYEMQG
jgi:hypothetical protein